MPRGVYDRTKRKEREPAEDAPQEFGFENTITLDGIDHLLHQADADELALAIITEIEPQLRANILASIMQARLNRILEAPPNIAQIGEQLRTFGPPQPLTENPEHAQTGTDPA